MAEFDIVDLSDDHAADREKIRVIDFLRQRANGLWMCGSVDARKRAETVEALARDIEQGKHRP